ncbi:uncharacterized protein OCT59_005859 [Rhizophagus irregularis]|uniref:uncharacterized protein n=1 Tax=Rhizophagus irregularis TaxID=588596 RepID=UPI003326F40E|nr:hypothetical protein OCT59_005859 [Rhizophagus irregularis]
MFLLTKLSNISFSLFLDRLELGTQLLDGEFAGRVFRHVGIRWLFRVSGVRMLKAWEFATFWLFGHGDFDDPSPLNRQFFSSDTYFDA